MSLIDKKNEESQYIWDVCYACELSATVGGWSERKKRQYLIDRLPPKSKRWAHKSLKRIANSGSISMYVDSMGKNII